MERLNQFDILKAVGIILVIVGHTIGPNILCNIIYSFHMPLFFLVSGYFFKVKNPSPPIKQLGKRLLTPYLLSCIILILSNVILAIYSHTFDSYYLFNWLQSIIYGNGVTEGTPFQSIGALWFLLALFWAMLILHLILLLQKIISPIFTSILCIVTSLYLVQHQIILPLSLSQGMFGVGYLYIGYLIKQHHPSVVFGSKIGLIPIAILWIVSFKSGYLSVLQCYAKPELVALVGALCGTYFAYLLSKSIAQKENKLCSLFTYIGKITLLILCVHSIEDNLVPWRTYINGMELNNYLLSSLILLRVIIVICIAMLLQRIKLVRKIFNS